MRITDGYTRLGLTPAAGAGRKSAGRVQGSDGPTASGDNDQVSVSAKSLELSSKATEAESARVAQLRAAIDSGTFKVDANEIAERMMRGA